jgi:antitoxin component of RelBE/YafQ-DinJ toxin-antitoxin module
MSLKQYAKKKKKEKTSVITARIPQTMLEKFKEYCDDLDITINEAINFLIKNELENEYKEYTESIQTVVESDDENVFKPETEEEESISFIPHIRTHDTHEVINPEERYNNEPIAWDTDDPIERYILESGMR